MVRGKSQKAVFGVPAADHIVDDEAIGLDDVHSVERRPLRDEVAQIQAIGSVASDDVQFLELGIEDHVCRRGASAFNLKVLDAEDADEVLLVRARLLLLIAEDLVAGLDPRRSQVIAGIGVGSQAGLLQVDPWQHVDGRAWVGYMIDRGLKVAIPMVEALGEQLQVPDSEVGRERTYPVREVGGVGLADDQMRTCRAIDRHASGAVGRLRRALGVRERRRRPEGESHRHDEQKQQP